MYLNCEGLSKYRDVTVEHHEVHEGGDSTTTTLQPHLSTTQLSHYHIAKVDRM